MHIYYNYLPKQFSDTKDILKIGKLISSTDFTLGKYVSEFVKKFEKYINVKHCISTNTGTDALIIALKSLGIKNDEVITVCNSFTLLQELFMLKKQTNFYDSDHRYQIDVNKIEKNYI